MNWLTEKFQEIDAVFTDRDRQTKLSLHENTAEFQYFIAKAELEQNRDLLHGMSHLAELLTYDPTYPTWLDLLATYLAKAEENPESLLSEADRDYYAIEAVRAYIYQKSGKLSEAIQILNGIAKVKPDSLYMDTWGIDWLSQPGAIESLPAEISAYILSSTLIRFPELRYLTHRQQQYVERYAELAQRFLQASDADTYGDAMEMMYVGFLRKAGRFREAFTQARSYYHNSPGWRSAVALGLVFREMEQIAMAEKAFRQALKFDPADMTARMEIADMYFRLQDWAKAKTVYEEVPPQEPKYEWAYPSALFCDWQMHPEKAYPQALIDLMSGEAPNYRANQLVERFRPYTGYLPEPSDATANLLRQLIEQEIDYKGRDKIRVTLSCLESPSNDLAFKLTFGTEVELEMVVESIPEPDPRQALSPVVFTLWQYQGTQASPALAPPKPEVSAAIAAIAREPLEISELWAVASRQAQQLKAATVEEIMAVMVHPSPVPEGFNALTWLPRLQLTTAFILAHFDRGWLGSTRRDALYSILFGIRDWTTVAAIIALACLAEEYPAISDDIHMAFRTLAQAAPNLGACCYEHALYYNWLRLPHLVDEEREKLIEELRAIENDGEN